MIFKNDNYKYVLLFLFCFQSIIYSKEILLSNNQNQNIDEDFLTDISIISADHHDLQFIAKINIGTPTQTFNILIDSGSDILWVHGINCQTCSFSQNLFNGNNSKTYVNYKRDKYIKYGTGSIEGVEASDMIGFEGMKPVKLNFIVVNKSDSLNADGIVGLSNVNHPETSLLDKLYQEKIIKNPIFTQNLESKYTGILGIGEIPVKLKNLIIKYPNILKSCPYIEGRLHWTCTPKRIYKHNSNTNLVFQKNDNEFMFDSGSVVSNLSLNNFNKFVDTFFNNYIKTGECYIKDNFQSKFTILICEESVIKKIPSFRIEFDNGEIVFFNENLFVLIAKTKIRNTYFCTLLVLNANPNLNLIGMNALSDYYVVYNKINKIIEYAPNPVFRKLSDFDLEKDNTNDEEINNEQDIMILGEFKFYNLNFFKKLIRRITIFVPDIDRLDNIEKGIETYLKNASTYEKLIKNMKKKVEIKEIKDNVDIVLVKINYLLRDTDIKIEFLN